MTMKVPGDVWDERGTASGARHRDQFIKVARRRVSDPACCPVRDRSARIVGDLQMAGLGMTEEVGEETPEEKYERVVKPYRDRHRRYEEARRLRRKRRASGAGGLDLLLIGGFFAFLNWLTKDPDMGPKE